MIAGEYAPTDRESCQGKWALASSYTSCSWRRHTCSDPPGLPFASPLFLSFFFLFCKFFFFNSFSILFLWVPLVAVILSVHNKVVRTEGWGGLYSGLKPSLFGTAASQVRYIPSCAPLPTMAGRWQPYHSYLCGWNPKRINSSSNRLSGLAHWPINDGDNISQRSQARNFQLFPSDTSPFLLVIKQQKY